MKIEIPLYNIKIKFYFDFDLSNPINKIKRKHKKKKLYKLSKLIKKGEKLDYPITKQIKII
jgi:hypothetical protein